MISRLTASAAVFAIVGAACMAFAAEAQQPAASAPVAARATVVETATTITLPRVEITGHRIARR